MRCIDGVKTSSSPGSVSSSDQSFVAFMRLASTAFSSSVESYPSDGLETCAPDEALDGNETILA